MFTSQDKHDRRKKSARKGRGPKPFKDFVPGRIANAFSRDLSLIVDELAEQSFKGSYLKSEYLSKYCDPTTTSPDARREAAIVKWRTQEAKNAVTNCRLMMADPDKDFGWTNWEEFRSKTRRIVSDILGPLSYPLVLWDSGHTGGASTRVKKSPTAIIDKLTGEAHCSEAALPHWSMASTNTMLEDQNLEIRNTSGLFTVPKSTDIDRVACKEPEINMFLQRSVGNHMRQRLKRFGIDLNDQSRNQDLAKTAVKRGLATIDLSSASDSITKQLVFELLPFDWWSLLEDLRVSRTIIVENNIQTSHEFEMFSAMGNGFTFELESLLFYAITRAVSWLSGKKGTISVYGDDIIAPCSLVPRLVRMFDFLGFKTNQKKTNFTGLFRESCGRHYHGSVEVTPFYIRAPIAKMSDLIRTLNQLLLWDGREFGFFTDPLLADFHKKWSAIIPSVLHGGQNIESIDSLVTGDPPRKRIVHRMDDIGANDNAMYLSWHVSRRLTGETPLEVAPQLEASKFLGGQPRWLERTNWLPYAIMA